MINTVKPTKPIRSFVIREGRMTKGQQRAIEELWPLYGLDLGPTADKPINLLEHFDRMASLSLEIGFGDGGALFQMASENPDKNFIGVEVHRPGVGKLLLDVHNAGLTNVRVFRDDGNDVLTALADNCLSSVNLFFPDPWHKKRHHKRRILRSQFIDLVVRKMRTGGRFHFATDWRDYALEALELLEGVSCLRNCSGQGLFSPRPIERPVTKFEIRGQRLGHEVWDIVMEKADLS